MTKEQVYDLDRKRVLHSWSVQGTLNPMVIDKAEGIYFWDADGNRYMDMSSQLVNVNIGFGNKKSSAGYSRPGYETSVYRSGICRKRKINACR